LEQLAIFRQMGAEAAEIWWGDPDANFGLATVEGGDVMPIGNGGGAPPRASTTVLHGRVSEHRLHPRVGFHYPG
jgi:hypothetical protein